MRLVHRYAPPALVFLVVLAIWYGVSYLVLSPGQRFLLPPPDAVVQIGFLEPANLGPLLRGLLLSAEVAMIGLALAFVLGVGLAVLMSQARWVERSLYPYAVVLQTVPILALVPLFGFWFGFGLPSRILVCLLIALFPLIANSLHGLQSAERAHHDLFTLHGAGRLTRLWKLQLPGALPSIFVGLRISAGLSVIGAVVGDFFFRQGQPGIGMLIDLYRATLQSEQMFAAVFLASGFGLAVFGVFSALARRVAAWQGSITGAGDT